MTLMKRFTCYRVQSEGMQARPCRTVPISLGVKQMGAHNAGPALPVHVEGNPDVEQSKIPTSRETAAIR
jgi:hypothetical protein